MKYRCILLIFIPAMVLTTPCSIRADTDSPTPSLSDTLKPYQLVLDNDQLQTVEILENQITHFRRQARYVDAIPLAEEILSIRRSSQGDDHWETSDALRLLNTLHHVAGLSPEDQAKLAEADRSDDEVCRLFAEGDLEATAELVRHSLASRKEVLGDEHIEVAIAIDDLASVLRAQGDIARAELLFRQSLLLNRKILGSDHPELARAMNNLAVVFLNQGNPGTESLQQEALNINRRMLGDLHPHTITDLSNLAGIRSAYDLDEAIDMQREAVSLAREVYGENNLNRLNALQNLISLLHDERNAAEAESLLQEVSRLCELNSWVHERHYSLYLFQRSSQCALLGQFEQAISLVRQALSMDESLYENDDLDIVKDRYRLAELLHLQGNFAEAETAWASACKSFEGARLRSGLNPIDRIRTTRIWSPFAYSASCLARLGKHHEAWTQLEAHFARSLADEIAIRTIPTLSPEERDLRRKFLDDINTLDERINALSTSDDSTSATMALIDSLQLIREDHQIILSHIEDEIVRTHGDVAGEPVTLDILQAIMEPDEALVAWIDQKGHPHAVDTSGEHWICVVRKIGDPWWFRLAGSGRNGEWIDADDSLTVHFKNLLRRDHGKGGSNEAIELARLAYVQRLAPAREALEGVRHVVVLPGGRMAGIPVEAITDEYTISYAPSATIFATARRSSDHYLKKSLLAIGDPPFSGVTDEHETPNRDEAIACLRSDEFSALPGTRLEVDIITRLFMESNPQTVPTVLMGSRAREQWLCKAVSNGELAEFEYLHFATHAVMNHELPLKSALILSQEDDGDALEHAIQGKTVYDGRITAEQIMRTWRLNAELVTLSACETALGKESKGEGILGFSHALFAAGARSILVSLWRVEDRATMLLMSRFYENLLGVNRSERIVAGKHYGPCTPIPKAAALHEAKDWLRNLTWGEMEALPEIAETVTRGLVPVEEPPEVEKGEHPFADPRYWAAFILMGDPR